MSATPEPTLPSPLLTPEQLTVLTASLSSLLFFVAVALMLTVIYRRDPQCCRPRSYQASRSDMASPPQYYSSRQTLVTSSCEQHIPEDNMQAAQLFYVGRPSSYSLRAPMPRLPSYESVRKKDRQRHIHMMIADRFGLGGAMVGEPPPTYEESLRHSVEIPYAVGSSRSDDAPTIPYGVGSSRLDDAPTIPYAIGSSRSDDAPTIPYAVSSSRSDDAPTIPYAVSSSRLDDAPMVFMNSGFSDHCGAHRGVLPLLGVSH